MLDAVLSAIKIIRSTAGFCARGAAATALRPALGEISFMLACEIANGWPAADPPGARLSCRALRKRALPRCRRVTARRRHRVSEETVNHQQKQRFDQILRNFTDIKTAPSLLIIFPADEILSEPQPD